MTESSRQGVSRSIATQVEIAVPAEAVWKALTDAVELAQWFAPEARVEGGCGGTIWLSWGEPIVAEWRIAVWEPNRHLRLIEDRPLGANTEAGENGGRHAIRSATETRLRETPRNIDYFLEGGIEKTILRLRHSGFPETSHWDDEFVQSVRCGWDFELRSLRHYLERHASTQRCVARVKRARHLPVEEVWRRLLGAGGLLGGLGEVAEGDGYATRAATGDQLQGIVQIYDPPRQFAATVANLNDSLFRIKLAQSPTGAVEAGIWLAAYGVAESEVKAFEQRWADQVDQILR